MSVSLFQSKLKSAFLKSEKVQWKKYSSCSTSGHPQCGLVLSPQFILQTATKATFFWNSHPSVSPNLKKTPALMGRWSQHSLKFDMQDTMSSVSLSPSPSFLYPLNCSCDEDLHLLHHFSFEVCMSPFILVANLFSL